MSWQIKFFEMSKKMSAKQVSCKNTFFSVHNISVPEKVILKEPIHAQLQAHGGAVRPLYIAVGAKPP